MAPLEKAPKPISGFYNSKLVAANHPEPVGWCDCLGQRSPLCSAPSFWGTSMDAAASRNHHEGMAKGKTLKPRGQAVCIASYVLLPNSSFPYPKHSLIAHLMLATAAVAPSLSV